MVPDSPLERFAWCLAVRAGAVGPWQAGRQDLKGSSVKGVIPGGASFSGQTHWEGPGISFSPVESHTEISENQTGLESTQCRESFSLCFTCSHALLAAAQCSVAGGAAVWGLPLLGVRHSISAQGFCPGEWLVEAPGTGRANTSQVVAVMLIGTCWAVLWSLRTED